MSAAVVASVASVIVLVLRCSSAVVIVLAFVDPYDLRPANNKRCRRRRAQRTIAAKKQQQIVRRREPTTTQLLRNAMHDTFTERKV